MNYPSVDVSLILTWLKGHDKVDSISSEAGRTYFALKGRGPWASRMRELKNNGTVEFNYALSIAVNLGKLNDLLIWLEKNKGWKDGGYTVKPSEV